MFGSALRSARRPGRYGVVAFAVAAVGFSTLTVSGGVASAEGPKIDRSAILRYGDDLTRGGGVLFDPTMAVTPGPTTRQIWDLIYDVMIHDTPDRKGTPGLAAKWATPDPSTVELTLQPNEIGR